jgi:alkyl hydroperoxide reductase subunit AhpC
MKTLSAFSKHSIIPMIFACFSALIASGQEVPVSREDSAAIIQTAMNYIDGYYSGDADRVEKAIHPDFNKAAPRDLPQTGRTMMNYTTWSMLMELTRAKNGALDDTARHITVIILGIENEVSDIKVISANFTDYLQVVKLDGEWKIINVIYTAGINTPPRLKDFDAGKEKPEVEKTAMVYLSGLSAADGGRLAQVIDPEFNRIALLPVAQTGKTMIRRQRYESVLESAFAGVGKQDEVYRNNKVTVIDIFDGLAIVKCEATGFTEYVQMYKGDGQWKLFNSIIRPNNNLTLQQAMTVIAGNPMPDFTLPVYGGGSFNLADYKGKNVMLMFPRGWVGNSWCSYCPYQYLELEQLEKKSGIMAKNNLQVVYVMPYSSEKIKDWMEKFPDALDVVEGIKNPQKPAAAGTIQADYSDWAKTNFPIVFNVKKDDPHVLIPILVDEDRTLSRQLKIFTGFWDGIIAEQNMASVFIIDKKGILRFKYIGQMTEDRPSVGFLLDFIGNMK